MKRKLNIFIIGAIITILLLSCIANADIVKSKIEVVLNSVKIIVNGQRFEGLNYNYDGAVYVYVLLL